MIRKFLYSFILFTLSLLLVSYDNPGKKKIGKKGSAVNKTIAGLNSSINKKTFGIIIDKSDSTLKIYDGNVWYATYPVVFGSDDTGDKVCEGDKKTPEGKFKIISKRWDTKWGAVLMLDYPTPESFKKFLMYKSKGLIAPDAKIGGNIAIHGTEPDKEWAIDYAKNWTDGCISLKYSHAKEIYNFIEIGTQVVILNSPKKEQSDAKNTQLNNQDLLLKEDTTAENAEEKLNRILQSVTKVKPKNKPPVRERLINESIVAPAAPIAAVMEVKTPDDSYLSAVEKARKYFSDDDRENSLKYYKKAFSLNKESALSDTIKMIQEWIRYDSALLSANDVLNAASKAFKIDDSALTAQKIFICDESIKMFKTAILAYNAALEMDKTAGAPPARIIDCFNWIKKIEKIRDEFESNELIRLYKLAKSKGDEFRLQKDYTSAVKFFEEAVSYLKSGKLKNLGNFVGELDFMSGMLERLKLQVSNQNVPLK